MKPNTFIQIAFLALFVLSGLEGNAQGIYTQKWLRVIDSSTTNVDQIAGFSSPTGGCSVEQTIGITPKLALSPSGNQVACIGISNCNIITSALNSIDGSNAFQDIYTGSSPETGVGLAYDKNNNLFSLGELNAIYGGGSGNTNFLRKYNSTGSIQFTDIVNNYTRNGDAMMQLDTNGNVMLYNVSFNGSTNLHPLYNYNNSGTFQWSSIISDYDYLYGYSGAMEIDDSGNTVFTGKYEASAYQVVIRKVNPAGTQLWEVYYSSYPNVYADHIGIDKDRNIYMTIGIAGSGIERVVKFNGNNGSIIWDVPISLGSGPTASVYDVKVNTDSNLVVMANQYIYYINHATGSAIWSKTITNMVSLGTDVNGNVYSVSSDTLRIYNSAGTLFGTVSVSIPGYTARINSIAISPTGNFLYLLGERSTSLTNKIFVAKYSNCTTVTAAAITGSSSVCTGSNLTLTDTTSGGIWSSSNTGVATVGSTGSVTGLSAGVDTIKYTITNVCGTAIATKIVTVNPLPSVYAVTGGGSYCAGGSGVHIGLSGSDTGVVYTLYKGGAIVSTSTGTGSIIDFGLQVAGGLYTVTATACGVSMSGSVSIVIIPAVVPNISLLAAPGTTICPGIADTFNTTIVNGGSSPVYQWSINGVAVGGSGSSYSYIPINGDIVKVKLTSNAVCALPDTMTTTATITVNSLPTAGTISGSSSVCTGASTSLTDGITGGLWGATNGNAIISSGGAVYGLIAGIDTIKYIVTNTCGTAITTKIITVNPLPTAGTISGSSSVCAGSTITLSNTATGGTWSSSNTGIATIGTTGLVTGVATGVDTVKYVVTNGCGTATTTKIITVNPLPTAGTISGSSSVCIGASTTLTDGIIGGLWGATNGNAIISSGGVVYGLIAGIDTVTYSFTNSCGTAIVSKIITVNPLPTAGTISGSSTVCVSSTITLSNTVTGGTWSSSNTGIATIGSTGVVTGMTAGTDTMIYTFTNTCGTAIVSKIITVNPLPTAGTISGSLSVCIGASTTLTDGITGGLWSATNGNTIVSSGGVVHGLIAGNDTVTYSVTNSCGSVATTKIITVNPLPAAGTISGSSTVCISDTVSLSEIVFGGVWSISNANAAISGGIVTGIIAGIDTVIYTVTNSCGTATTNKIVSINPLPTAGTITGADTVCMTEFITVVDTTTGGVWSSMVGTASVSSTGLVTGVNPGADTILYTVTNSCGSAVAKLPIVVLQPGMCSSGIKNLPEQSQDITLYPNPTQNNITLSSLLPINTVVVSNLLGQKVFTGVYNDNKVVINLGQLPEGIYLLKINNAFVYKVIKQ